MAVVTEKNESTVGKKTSTTVTKETQTRKTSIITLKITTVDVKMNSTA